MSINPRSFSSFRPSLYLILLAAFLGVLWLAGGASRADVPGQAVVRIVAWAMLVIAILFGSRLSLEGTRPVLIILVAALLLTLAQLIPLPPGVWQELPGRDRFAEAMVASGQVQPWRPWSIVPSATINAASSLIVPFVTLMLLLGLRENERSWLPGMLLTLITASTLIGLMQFSGIGFDNPLINDMVGDVSGSFANRNHFALFLAFGCLLAPLWAFLDGRQPRWRAPVALGLVLLFALTILASGSRAGLILGLIALAVALILVRQAIRKALSRYPRWVFFALVASIVAAVAIFVLISVAADRAVSIDRSLAEGSEQERRALAFPIIMQMIGTYFPAGSGLGAFDPVFRIHEPFEFLSLKYLNHAHNDFLEVVLDAGLPGLLVLLSAMLWWAWASLRAWRAGPSVRNGPPKLGSALLFLVMMASVFDYPARTPMIMAMMVVAGVWLGGGLKSSQGAALPKSGQAL
jgi:O-antigen ligase